LRHRKKILDSLLAFWSIGRYLLPPSHAAETLTERLVKALERDDL
jgi:hypothetical protein